MGVWAEDVQEIEVPQVVDEVQKADFVVDDFHVEYEKAKAEVE